MDECAAFGVGRLLAPVVANLSASMIVLACISLGLDPYSAPPTLVPTVLPEPL